MATLDQLRDDIDSGKTGDKIAASDPAAAPLGTDSEAAGTQIDADQIAVMRALEPRRTLRTPSKGRTFALIYFRLILGMGAIFVGAVLFLPR